MTEINRIKGIVVGQYGTAVQLQVVDEDGNSVDISSYTATKTLTLRDPFTLKSLSYTASFVSDGVDGKFQFTPANGDIDRPGEWEGQLKLTSASASAFTVVFTVEVEKRISAA